MEKEIREVIRFKELDFDFVEIFNRGIEAFGEDFARIFLEKVKHEILGLSFQYHLHANACIFKLKHKFTGTLYRVNI